MERLQERDGFETYSETASDPLHYSHETASSLLWRPFSRRDFEIIDRQATFGAQWDSHEFDMEMRFDV